MRLDWKIYAIGLGVLMLSIMVFFLQKVFFFLAIVLATILLAVVLRFSYPIKYLGVELITLSTMLVGVSYGPILGGIYAFTMLLVHLVVGDYYIGPYLMWLIPEYVVLGILSGILGTSIIGPIGVFFIVSMNLLNLFFTFVGEPERFSKELPFAIGNSVINSAILLKFLSSVVNFIG